MKTIPIHSLIFKSIFLLPALILFWSFTANAQQEKNTGKTDKRTVSIHISKELDGKTTQIDTTFEANDEFDVDAWVNEHDSDARGHRHMKKIDKEIEIRMPDFDTEDFSAIPDTVIVNGDTAVVNTKIEKMFRDNPDFGDLDLERHLDMPDELSDAPPCQQMEEMPGCCPFMRGQHMQDRFPFGELNFPGLDNLIPFGELDRIVVKKKRHGKEIIISLRDNEDERDSRHHHGDRNSHNDRDTQMRPPHQQRIIIRKGNGKEIEKDENTKVERYKEGNNEIIIIKKNKEGDKNSEK